MATGPSATVSWHRVGYGPPGESDAWNIGIELVADARGHGYGVRGAGAGRAIPVRAHRRQSRRGADRHRQHRRATGAREGRLRPRGGHPRLPVPGRRLSRPRDLLDPAFRGRAGLTDRSIGTTCVERPFWPIRATTTGHTLDPTADPTLGLTDRRRSDGRIASQVGLCGLRAHVPPPPGVSRRRTPPPGARPRPPDRAGDGAAGRSVPPNSGARWRGSPRRRSDAGRPAPSGATGSTCTGRAR